MIISWSPGEDTTHCCLVTRSNLSLLQFKWSRKGFMRTRWIIHNQYVANSPWLWVEGNPERSDPFNAACFKKAIKRRLKGAANYDLWQTRAILQPSR